MIELAELMMILDLHREGLSVSAISRACGIDRKTIRMRVPTKPATYSDLKPAKAGACSWVVVMVLGFSLAVKPPGFETGTDGAFAGSLR